MEKPLISVVIPTLNRGFILSETLNSLLDQSYSNWECIIVDDDSTDNTKEVVENYLERDNRFNYFLRPLEMEKGASACRNFGLEMAKGSYIQFLDSDDLLGKNKFEEQIKDLSRISNLGLVTCKWGSFNSYSRVKVKMKYRSYGDFKPGVNLLYNFGKHNEYFPPLVYLVPRELIEKAGKWNENLSHNDDGEFFTRILIHSDEVIFSERASVYYRSGNTDRLSLLDNNKKIQSAIYSWKLIEDHLKHKYKKLARVYVKTGKRNIYGQIKNSSPEIVDQHYDFFKEVLPFKKRLKMLFK